MEQHLLNILPIVFLCTVKLLKIQACQNQKKKNIFQWYSCTDILLIWRNCSPHERTCTHKPTHTRTVKVDGPAIGPDSTVLYRHGTQTTLRLDELLGEQMTTVVGFNTSEGSITGRKTAAVSLEDFLFLSQPWESVMKKKTGVFPLAASTPDQTVPLFHHILRPRANRLFMIKNALVSASLMWLFAVSYDS